MSEIKSMKLVTGEELVAEIVENAENTLSVKNPVVCLVQRSENGPMLGFAPWMQSADSPFKIEKAHIIIVAEVADEVKNGYNKIFGAGIVVPPKGLITG